MKLTENQIVDFKFDEHTIQASLQQGNPVFTVKEVCHALGINKYRDAVSRLDPEEKGRPLLLDTLGGPQEVATVNESGLYALIFMSRKPAAIRFRKWVTGEVLPTLRKSGFYAVGMDAAIGKARRELYRTRKRLSFLEAMADLDREPVPGVEYLSVSEYFQRRGVTPSPNLARRVTRLAVIVSRQRNQPYVCLYRTVHSGPTKMFPMVVLEECDGILPEPRQKLLPLSAEVPTVTVDGTATPMTGPVATS